MLEIFPSWQAHGDGYNEAGGLEEAQLRPVAGAVQNPNSFGQLCFVWSFQVGMVPCEPGPAVLTHAGGFAELLQSLLCCQTCLGGDFSG